MKRPPLVPLLLAASILNACAGKPPAKPPTAPPPQTGAGHTTTPRQPAPPRYYASRSIKSRILSLATREWEYFGKQTVIYGEDGESIPHVGAWEDDDRDHSDRVNQYWRAAYTPGLNGEDCRQPWSAAFVSWVMMAAGVSEELFPPAKAHWVYLSRFVAQDHLADALFIAQAIKYYSPKPGDLICATRGNNGLSPRADELPETVLLENTKLHCDIVVEKDGQTLYAIGGNVRNSVSKSVLKLSPEGLLQPTRSRHWFVVVENRLY